jgi:broad specificity phosphatase PhoE
MALRLYLLRHGETEFSRQDRYCGHIDAPLTKEGRRMAAAVAHCYGLLSWRAILTSTRERAITTAEPLATRAGLPIRREARLDEMYYGTWQGLSKAEAAAKDPAHYRQWRLDPTIGTPSGESPFEVCARAASLVDELRTRYAEGNVLIVSHKAVLRLILCRLTGVELRHYRQLTDWPVAAMSAIDLESEGGTLRMLADVQHLSGLDHPRPASQPEAGGDFVGEEHASFGQPDALVVNG